MPTDTAAITRGEHLARTRGCRGCHGKDLTGQVMWGHAVAPNLPQSARQDSAATLETALRHGIGRDGRDGRDGRNRRAMCLMPPYNFVRLGDADGVGPTSLPTRVRCPWHRNPCAP